MKHSGFKFKARKPLKRTPFKPGEWKPLKRTKLRVVGHSTTAELKQEIQDTLRALGLLRDGGCVLRHYSEAGACGGRRKSDDALILQAEHLVTRENSLSFADMRNIVILCRNHHIFFKKEHGMMYWNIIRDHIGDERWKWIERVQADRTPHKMDLKLELLALKQDLKKAREAEGTVF